jgi:hypothetical protein
MKGKSLSNGVIHLSLKVRWREVLREIILIAAKAIQRIPPVQRRQMK